MNVLMAKNLDIAESPVPYKKVFEHMKCLFNIGALWLEMLGVEGEIFLCTDKVDVKSKSKPGRNWFSYLWNVLEFMWTTGKEIDDPVQEKNFTTGFEYSCRATANAAGRL